MDYLTDSLMALSSCMELFIVQKLIQIPAPKSQSAISDLCSSMVVASLQISVCLAESIHMNKTINIWCMYRYKIAVGKLKVAKEALDIKLLASMTRNSSVFFFTFISITKLLFQQSNIITNKKNIYIIPCHKQLITIQQSVAEFLF